MINIAVATDRIEEIEAGLDAAVHMLTTDRDADFAHFLLRPGTSPQNKQHCLEATCDRLGLPQEIKGLMALLIARRRARCIGDIRREYRRLADRHLGITRARVETARPLEADRRERLAAALSGKVGGRVVLDVVENKALIAGLRVTAAGRRVDNSLQARLKELKRRMMGN